MLHTILRWAAAAACIIPAITMIGIMGSDMPYLPAWQAFGVRALAFTVLCGIAAVAYMCAKNGLLPTINDPDEED